MAVKVVEPAVPKITAVPCVMLAVGNGFTVMIVALAELIEHPPSK